MHRSPDYPFDERLRTPETALHPVGTLVGLHRGFARVDGREPARRAKLLASKDESANSPSHSGNTVLVADAVEANLSPREGIMLDRDG